MTKEEITKKINSYSKKKIIIVSLLMISAFLMCICLIIYQFMRINWAAFGAMILYLVMLVMMIIASRFNLNEPLMKTITIDDYKEMLKYMAEIPFNIPAQIYYDGLFMIKRTLDEMVYYHIYVVDDIFRQHLCYLQSMFLRTDNTGFISSKVLNKSYLRGVSKLLYEQIESGRFNAIELDSYDVKEEIIDKRFHVSGAMITNLLNVMLVLIVTVKVVITINGKWYNSINELLFWRIMYNTSIDVIAAFLAIIALQKR